MHSSERCRGTVLQKRQANFIQSVAQNTTPMDNNNNLENSSLLNFSGTDDVDMEEKQTPLKQLPIHENTSKNGYGHTPFIPTVKIPPQTTYWTDRFYELLDDNKPGEAIEWLNNFNETATQIGKEFIERRKDPEIKLLKPGQLGIAGGHKGRAHGMFVKFDQDGFVHNGSIEDGMKVSGNELRTLKIMHRMGSRMGLRFPLMVLVDYAGWRVIVESEVPIKGKETLKYGSMNGPQGPFEKDNTITPIINQLLSELKIAEQTTGLGTYRGPFDLEGHIKDGKMYLLDVARVFPPNNAQNRMHHLFRAEFLQLHQKEVPTEDDTRRNSFVAWYHQNWIPNFTEALNTYAHTTPCIGSVIDFLHYHGVNLRHMGAVYQRAVDHIKPILLLEMVSLFSRTRLINKVARCIKHDLRTELRKVQHPTEQNLKQPILNYFLKFFGSSQDYCQHIQQNLQTRFFENNSGEIPQWKRHITECLPLFQRVCELTGINFLNDLQTRIKEWTLGRNLADQNLDNPLLTENDLRQINFLQPKVKTVVPIIMSQRPLHRTRQYAKAEKPDHPEFETLDSKEIDGIHHIDSEYRDLRMLQLSVTQDLKEVQRLFNFCKVLDHANLLRVSDDTWEIHAEKYLLWKEPIISTLAQDLDSIEPKSYLEHLESILHILSGIAKGLEYLHSKRIVFRHLVPGNVLIVPTEVRQKALLFTPALINPSVPQIPSANGAKDVQNEDLFNQQSDVYCFGLILQQLIRRYSSVKENVASKEELDIFQGDIKKLRNLTSWCLYPIPEERATLTQIIQTLNTIEVSVSEGHPLLQKVKVDLTKIERTGEEMKYQGIPVITETQSSSSSYQILEMVERRGKLNRDLDHNNIRKLFGVQYNRNEGKLVWYLERVEIPLFEYLVKNPTLTQDFITSVANGIAAGLHYLHEVKKISVNDLAPKNIFLTNGEPKIASFEKAEPQNQGEYDLRSMQKMNDDDIRYYMAPEIQFTNSRSFNPSTDVYAFGVILWELQSCLVKHKIPFKELLTEKEDIYSLPLQTELSKLLMEERRPDIDASVPSEIRETITRCWNQDRNKRPPARDLIELLQGKFVNAEGYGGKRKLVS